MRVPILILGAIAMLGACSSLRTQEAPVCDGRHRRPANVHGSVLDPVPTPAPPPGPTSAGGCA